MKTSRINIGSIRREQIVDAAVAVIAEQGLQNLSLSEIEKRAGMTRGHLTYYFATKEAILLGVFDRLLQLMCQKHEVPSGPESEFPMPESVEEVFRLILEIVLEPQANAEFHALQYTFLSQIGHREDFRQRLASLYEDWRCHMAEQLTADQKKGRTTRSVSPRAMACLIQAILHGLAIQLEADPNAFHRQEMQELCLDVVGSYLKAPRKKKPPKKALVNGSRSSDRRNHRS